MNANGQLVETLSNSSLFRDYERAYTETTGLPVTLRPVETWQLPLHGRRNESSFCALMAEKSRTCAACLQLQEKLSELAQDGPATATCVYGLCETAVPVKVGRQTVGFLQTGQVLREKPTAAKFEQAAAMATKLGVSLDRARARAAFFQTPVMTPRKLQSVSHLLSTFAENLSFKSNQIAIQQANAEPPVISRAKQYIREHIMDKLTLSQVSAAVHLNQYYFCKTFRRVTGLTFTEFVARTRTETAKNLLLNPNVRVSEIAYASGFQSLTHFNRVFKTIVGESPTEYRERLPRLS